MTFSDGFDDATVFATLRHAARLWGDREAYVFDDVRLTFASTFASAAAIAAGLIRLGIRVGDRIAVVMANYAEWPAVYFGVAGAGGVLVPLNTRLTPTELADLMVRSGAVAVVYRADAERGRDLQGRVRAALGSATQIDGPRYVIAAGSEPGAGELALDEIAEAGRGAEALLDDVGRHVSPEGIATVLYTSGSTGAPKGAMLRHREMHRGCWYSSRALDIVADDRFFSPQPFFHAGGAVQAMLAPVVTGCTTVTQAYFDPAAALAAMERERCTITLGHQPHWVDYLAQYGLRSQRLFLRSGYVIGDPSIRHHIYERLGLVTTSPYGMTETHLGGTAVTLADGVDACLNTNGKPFPGVELVIRDVATDEPVLAGEIGEVCLGGWCPMAGYLDDDERTADMYDHDGYIRTGDLGLIDDHGYLRLVGRRREMIRVGGENVSPAEVVDVLCSHPSIKQAVVVGLDDARLGEVPAAAIETHEGTSVDTTGIQSFCAEHLARYKVPRRIVVLSRWPMTGTGKIDRLAVSAELTRGESRAQHGLACAKGPETEGTIRR